MSSYIRVALVFVGVSIGISSSVAVGAACTAERPGLLAAGNAVEADLEKFDTALHGTKASSKLIGIVHHFEEGILDFNSELRRGADCITAKKEFQHFHEDIQLIYRELDTNRDIFHLPAVLSAWNILLPSFIRLQDRLYR